MNCARARGRYLAALGLTGLHTAFAAFGCHGAESATEPAPSPTAASASAVEASPPKSTPTGAPAASHTGAWVPSEPPVPLRPGIAICPHGPFCVPQPADLGEAPAPAPLQACANTVPLPTGIGPDAILAGRQPTVTFDAARTTAERADDPAACCYQWHVLCVGGRALRGLEGPITAALAHREDWLAPEGSVDTATLGAAAREALTAHWEREAAFEHASIGAFAQASLALLAVGAPADLVAATHAAALDEIEHARLAYALASAYGGVRRGPGPMPASGITGNASLATLAMDTFLDGCAGETTAALALREAAAMAEEGAVRLILERIAEDEERHAELAWRTVAWALRTGGEEVARRLFEGTAMLRGELHGGAKEPAAGLDLSAHGVLSEAARQAIRRRAVAEVVIPCAEALLRANEPEPATAGAGRGDSA
jgi:hypothetical protein